MPGYISEFDYFGVDNQEFIEVAVPTGTDVSSYSLLVYDVSGTLIYTFSLGAFSGTVAGQDVYVLDDSTPGFSSAGDSMGVFYSDDAIALVDDTNTVLQFVSWEGNSVSASSGPANGLTSTSVGSIADINTGSLQSDNGGSSYYEQTSQNKGTIPACYTAGCMIDTPDGPRAVETLCAGDRVLAHTGLPVKVLWVWSGIEAIDASGARQNPVHIVAGALGENIPNRDLIVSSQHRICVGGFRQLEHLFEHLFFVPAKALVGVPGIREIKTQSPVEWFHFACSAHHIVTANGCASESLLLGPMVVTSLPRGKKNRVLKIFEANAGDQHLNGSCTLPCLNVQFVKRLIRQSKSFPEPAPFVQLQCSNPHIDIRIARA